MKVKVTEQVAARIRQRMQEIIDAKLPLRRHECTTEEAIKEIGRASCRERVSSPV